MMYSKKLIFKAFLVIIVFLFFFCLLELSMTKEDDICPYILNWDLVNGMANKIMYYIIVNYYHKISMKDPHAVFCSDMKLSFTKCVPLW